ncbi:MAG TPA: group III truncated hemoglobin [Acidobacteriaceae bacterium]
MNPEQLPTEAQISTLVDRFYAKVREDDEIGPVFEDAVHNWDAHLKLLKEFWSTVLLASAQYKGNPLLAHFKLPIEEHYFDRWLNLFAETADEVMTPPQAAFILRKAHQIAGNMKRVLAYREPSATAAPPAAPFGTLANPSS